MASRARGLRATSGSTRDNNDLSELKACAPPSPRRAPGKVKRVLRPGGETRGQRGREELGAARVTGLCACASARQDRRPEAAAGHLRGTECTDLER